MIRPLAVEPLTRAAFAAYGDLIEADSARDRYMVNAGTATRFDDLAHIDTASHGGHPLLSIFRAAPRALPFDVVMLESHPLGSQAFVPLDPALAFVVVVAADPDAAPRAFLARHGQGVNYHRGTWHHPLIALERGGDFLVVDRGGEGHNCDEVTLDTTWRVGHARV
ncbi:ureidoglycolate lyase [Dokdonella immobilis]|uniref:Ureidoglycolate lyase n=1 Tax=Dokdonella immobilis TaxID=578942 RepID=A0A1I5AL95_9GAMM|nr:ureidoglycolate lyase [Dokdonella immobilis]SFN63130.1 ureidoglycolate lyase [Dokdonella immobilis]